ncbi:MAG: PEP-CTERM sorting domain-containing protein [Gemmatimonadaceae bacterium]
MISKIVRSLSVIPILATLASAQPMLGTNPGIPSNLQITTFASGLGYPYGMYQLPDGSMLVATGTGALYGSQWQIQRINQIGGIATAPTVVFSGDGFTPTTGMAGVGDIVAVASGIKWFGEITLFRAGVGGTLTQIGQMTFDYPNDTWWHDSHQITMRAVPGQPNSYELIFNVGSEFNDTPTLHQITVAGLVNGSLNGSSIYRMPFTVNGSTVTASPPVQIATGLRNAFGLGFNANGDLYFSENGIDLNGTNVPVSTDYFGIIPAGTAGILDFGFPNTYYNPTTGQMVGSGAGITQPFAKFLPIDGMATQGAGGLAVTTAGFLGMNAGAFVGFFGNHLDGVGNTLDGVIYVDAATGNYFDFLPNSQPGLNHPVSLFAGSDGLYIADLGSIVGGTPGAIYRVSVAATTVPEPATVALFAVGAVLIGVASRRRTS